MTSLALTKLDVLSAFGELPVCVRYRLRDGSETEEFPAYQSDFHHCTPVYEILPGWAEPLDEVSDLADLPDAAWRYISFVEEQLGVEVSLIGTGRERERVLARPGAEALAS
jgi:adenylosuccinate synthase